MRRRDGRGGQGLRVATAAFGVAVVVVAAAPSAAASGIGFSIVHTPNPSTSQGSYFGGVSCSSSTTCAAVGHYVDAGNAERALAEMWNGAGWGVVQVHLPPRTVSSELFKVSCASVTACMAVGKYDQADGIDRPLAERWDGSSWTDAGAVANGSAASSLNSVSCSTAAACVAVGYDSNPPSGDALTETWDGTTWTVAVGAAPAGQFPDLSAVSCTSSTSCVAVGEYAGAGGELTLGERWNGTAWSLSKTRNRAGSAANYLYGITCSAATSCIVVGSYSAGGGLTRPLIETLSGTRWSFAQAPEPGRTSYSSLVGVACASSSSCIAVGSAAGFDSNGKSFADDWNGSSWTLDHVVNPHRTTGSYLNGAYCPAVGACTFAGDYSTNTSVDRTLIEVATPPGDPAARHR